MFKFEKAVCYSGYRENESPHHGTHPTDEEVLEDLLILAKDFKYIRMYNPYDHAKTTLRVIKKHNIPLKVMIGVEPQGEISNPNCAWGGLHTHEAIAAHKKSNYRQLDLLADLANQYSDIVLAVAVGNENTAFWHPNKMDPHVLADHVRYLKKKVNVPVTFCEGSYEWRESCGEVAEVADFISIHDYPLWHKVPIKDAVEYTIKAYEETIRRYPNKPVIFTEFGWTTRGNEQMDVSQTNEENQKIYLDALAQWSEKNQVTMFVFEAFDEPWKGGKDPNEPEKHWGIYTVERKPKLWMK